MLFLFGSLLHLQMALSGEKRSIHGGLVYLYARFISSRCAICGKERVKKGGTEVVDSAIEE